MCITKIDNDPVTFAKIKAQVGDKPLYRKLRMWMKVGMSILCAVSIIYYLYLGIVPILIYPDFLQFIALVSLIDAVVIPLSGMLETKFMERDDDDEIGPQEPYQQPVKTIEVK